MRLIEYLICLRRLKTVQGELTRKKIAKITSQILSDQQYAKAIGEMFVVISGRAGTGKKQLNSFPLHVT